MKIVYLDASTMGDTPLDPIAALGELVCYPTSTPEEALERVGDCDVLIINKIIVDKRLLAAAPRLKLVCEAATGVNNIDLEECASRGIPVKNVAGYSTDSVVQATFMHVLSLMGNAPYFDDFVKSGKYSRSPIFTDVSRPFIEMAGKTYGVVGMGNIGSRVAKVASAFGMKVIYYSTSGTGHCKEYPCVPLDELMSSSDVISIHAPYNARTAGLIGERELRLMKPTAFIVNMGRGGIVDEVALAKVVGEGAIGGAAMDVFSKEPLPSDNPLLHTARPERFRFTPHTAWASVEARARLVGMIADNIRTWLEGRASE
ncbi:MAG: D-2-hydroxyacid dehydrogenase [Bacteroidales bacterium]|nr:D-2-hydroxyacid dehydrogenase [Bacteroidales bacterium]